MARFKGNLYEAVRGVRALDTLKDGDRIVITGGVTNGQSGNTNTIQIDHI